MLVVLQEKSMDHQSLQVPSSEEGDYLLTIHPVAVDILGLDQSAGTTNISVFLEAEIVNNC